MTSQTIITALITLLSAVILDLFRRYLLSAKDKEDIGRSLRDELRGELLRKKEEYEELEETVKALKAENAALKEENATLKATVERTRNEYTYTQASPTTVIQVQEIEGEEKQ